MTSSARDTCRRQDFASSLRARIYEITKSTDCFERRRAKFGRSRLLVDANPQQFKERPIELWVDSSKSAGVNLNMDSYIIAAC